MIVVLPCATPVIVKVVRFGLEVLAGDTVAMEVALLVAVNVPELFAVSAVTVTVPVTETDTEVLDKVSVPGAALAGVE